LLGHPTNKDDQMSVKEAIRQASSTEIEILPPESGAGRSDGIATKQTRLGESLVSKRELARFLGISTSGLDKLIARGRVPSFVKVGRLLKWVPADVREWAASMQREVRLRHDHP
jgi:predicted DNA-binding transcriptional regulator AlpA